jgi:hypothetical protein
MGAAQRRDYQRRLGCDEAGPAERTVDVDEQERGERKLEAYEAEELEESGLEKMGDVSIYVNEELVLMGGSGPVPYTTLLTEEEYQDFRDLAEKKEPTDEEVARGQALLRLMMDRYPDGPTPK